MTEFCRTIAGTPGTKEYETARAIEGRDIWYSKSHGFIGCVNPQAGISKDSSTFLLYP